MTNCRTRALLVAGAFVIARTGVAQDSAAPVSAVSANASEKHAAFEVISIRRHVADRGPLRLGIHDNGVGHFEIGGFVDEDVAIPRPGFDHGHSGIFGYERDQACAAAWNNHVD